jgi:hypothetical protein
MLCEQWLEGSVAKFADRPPRLRRRLRNRSVVQVDRVRDALECIVLALLNGRLERHRVEQKTQRRLGVFAIDTAVLLVGEAGTIIDDGEQHQGRCALPIGVDPGRRLQLTKWKDGCKASSMALFADQATDEAIDRRGDDR